jgi:hypothetical protein
VTGSPGLVLPRWGTRRRTADEWVELGGDSKLLKPGDDLWPTLGHQPAMVSKRLGFEPMPHQVHIFDVAFELDPEKPDDLWYTEVDEWVMRQCAKTTTLFIVGVHRLTMMPRRMGGRQRVAFTMQDRQTTRKKLEFDFIPQLVESTRSFRRITNPKGRPGRNTSEWKSSLNNGAEHLLFGMGNYFLIDTPSKKAGHGDTIDVKMADEVRFGVDDRIEASAGPSQITRRSRQFWIASTAGDDESFYMWPKVLAGRGRVEREDIETRVCSFEWALPEDADLHDPDVWLEFHPAAGHTVPVDSILDELRKAEDSPDETKIDTFRQEYANQWVRTPIIGDAPHEVVIDLTMWARRAVSADSTFLRPRTLGVSVADDGRSASIALAAWNPDGRAQVKVLDHRAGTFWIERELETYRDDFQPAAITYNAGGPTGSIEGPIARAAGRVEVEPVRGQSYTAACSAFVTGFDEGRYWHMDQEWLNTAVEGASKKTRGTAWLWDMQNSNADVTPLDAATVALRALEGRPPEPRSAYEDDADDVDALIVGGR